MAQYNIKPFEMTPEFQQCWQYAGQYLNQRIKDTGGSWLRAELPPFREHLSFVLGNQIFFIQIMDVDNPLNGWVHENRLQAVVTEANGIACLMPMRKKGDEWQPTVSGWGLVDHKTGQPLSPFDLITDETIEMTDWEIHDFGIQTVRDHLREAGWTIESWQSDPQVDPSIFAHKTDERCAFVVRTANKGPHIAPRPDNATQTSDWLETQGYEAKFIGMKVASLDVPWHTDPEFQHLTRKIPRRSRLLVSPVEIQDLRPPQLN